MSKTIGAANLRAFMSPIFHTKRGGMRASVEARIRKDRKTASDQAAVIIQIIINGERTTIPVRVSWPVAFFDNKKGKFLERYADDQEARDYNMEVTKEKSKINDILMYYRHSDFELTIEQFKKEYRRYESRKDFYVWVLSDVQDRYDEGKVEWQTLKNAKSSVAYLKGWRRTLKFSELNEKLLENLEAYGRRGGCSINTIIARLSMVKNYARRANKSGIGVNMASLDAYKLPKPTSRIVFLNPGELQRMKEYRASEHIADNHRVVLDQFLFSCCTGLRYSDIRQVDWKHVGDDMIEIVQYKGRKNQKINRIPLIDEAYGYIQNQSGLLFDTMAEQPTNRLLKEIARAAGIRKNLTTHVARHTFATEFLRRGGHLEVLNKLMGHSKISTTMIYVHVDTSRLKAEMAGFAGGK